MNTELTKKDLWLGLANYSFDEISPPHLWDIIVSKFGGPSPFTLAFADKLCRKHNWTRKFALKAIWEYKKFVFLGVISDSQVTPSKIIDQVWHEHLLFSSGYRKFCESVIRMNFDHNPELVPVDSQTKIFEQQYLNTIGRYIQEFGHQPPADIWLTTKFTGEEKSGESTGQIYPSDYDSQPLISMFSDTGVSEFEFREGSFGGGGASGNWGDFFSDSSSSDSDSGSDSGSCSSCSSSCGGGD